MEKVSVVSCDRYDEDLVYAGLSEAMAAIGGMGAFVAPGQTVLVKPNLLAAVAPELAVTTHPSVMRAVVRLVQEAGAKEVWVGDSPATSSLEKAMDRCGLTPVVAATGAKVVSFDEAVETHCPSAKVFRTLPLARPVREADVIISVAKLKTHGLTSFTGAAKNLYGCIPGHRKAQYHLKAAGRMEFGNLIVDLHEAVKPGLSIIDGVTGMEGSGPRNGKPKQAGILMASRDAFALDAVAAALIGLPPKDVPYLRAAQERGLLDFSGVDEQVRLAPKVPPFALSASRGDMTSRVPKRVLRFAQRHLTPQPRVDETKCTGCAVCKSACPPEVISMRKGKAFINLDGCIRCYCCQELCPSGAVELREGWVLRRIFPRK